MTNEAAEILSQYGGELRIDYSGRGMYGKTTAGLVVDTFQDFFNAIADCFHDCMEDNIIEEADIVIKALKNLQSDNMGNGYIFY